MHTLQIVCSATVEPGRSEPWAPVSQAPADVAELLATWTVTLVFDEAVVEALVLAWVEVAVTPVVPVVAVPAPPAPPLPPEL